MRVKPHSWLRFWFSLAGDPTLTKYYGVRQGYS